MEKKHVKKAVALKYDNKKDDAPRITAEGSSKIAQKIIELAIQNNIPIKEDPDLVQVLSSLEINEEIPSEIYVVVAELLAFIYSTNKR